MKSRFLGVLSGAVLASVLLLPVPARADDSPASGAQADEPALSYVVEDSLPEAEAPAGSPSSFIAAIDRDQIAKAAPVSIAQVLETVPGVQVVRYGSASEGSYVSIRGSSPEQVLVLLNGKRLNSAQGGGVDLSTIDPETVERIEILRGGASARYGENALGGVVNIVTRQAKAGTGAGAYLQYGSWNTVKGGARVEGTSDSGFADGVLSVSGLSGEGAYGYERTDGSGTTTRKNADVLSGDAYGAFNLYPGDFLSLSGVFSGHADEKGVPGIPQFPTESARMADRIAAGSFAAAWEGESSTAESSLSATFRQRRYTDPDYALGAQDDTHTNFSLQSDSDAKRLFSYRGAGGAELRGSAAAGVSARFDALRSTAIARSSGLESGDADILRGQGSLSLRSSIPLPTPALFGSVPELYPSARLDAGVTRDEADDDTSSSSAVTWQLGAALPWEKVTAKANLGTSYRAPSFDDLFWPSTAFAAGNADLKPEKAFSWDAGLEFRPAEGFLLEASCFDRTVTDLIVWTPGAGGQWRPSNVDSARIRGVELQAKASAPIPAIGCVGTVQGSATWMDPRNTTSGSVNDGKLLPYKAPFTASGYAELSRKEGHYLRAECSYASYRYITAQNTKSLDPALVFNLGAGAKLGRDWEISGRIENIFDVVYYDLRDYPVPGREFSLRVSYEYEKK